MTWRVVIQPAALEMLRRIGDRRFQVKILARIEELARDPEKLGNPLLDEITGYRSMRAVGQRYRIIYRVVNTRVEVVVIAIGLRRSGDRRDAYEVARRLVRMRLV